MRLPLHHVFDYTDVDRAFWHERLEDWVPREIIDAHVHVTHPAHRREPVTEAWRRQYWVNEVNEPMEGPALARADEITFPGRRVAHVVIGPPDLAFDIDAANEYARREAVAHGWHCLALLRPEWSQDRVAAELAKPGVIGVKPYYTLLGRDPSTRDAHQEASIFAFLPPAALEVLHERRAWVTLHVPRAARLPHPDNLREIRELRCRYPDVVLVIAHLGRCYTEPHARAALPALADDPGLYFDNSAVLNPAVHRLALETLGPERILYGTDNPVFYMRGRRQWQGTSYVNRTSYPFHFNRVREAPEIEAAYTLYMYEALSALRTAVDALGLGVRQVEALFHGNAGRLIEAAVSRRRSS